MRLPRMTPLRFFVTVLVATVAGAALGLGLFLALLLTPPDPGVPDDGGSPVVLLFLGGLFMAGGAILGAFAGLVSGTLLDLLPRLGGGRRAKAALPERADWAEHA